MHHRAYQSLLPCANKYLQMKWDKASHSLHRRKVKFAKGGTDMSPPSTFGSLDSRSQKLKEKRQHEALLIKKENEITLFHLHHCNNYYNLRRWQEDWAKTVEVMDRIARYPRGKVKEHKGRDKPSKISGGSDKKQKLSPGVTTNRSASSGTNDRRDETGKETMTHNESAAQLVPKPKESISAENSASSVNSQNTATPSAQQSCSPETSTMSSTPHTTSTVKLETSSTEEG
ncbi:uncharacterized protein cfap97d2 [Odontesthes bonariensis]